MKKTIHAIFSCFSLGMLLISTQAHSNGAGLWALNSAIKISHHIEVKKNISYGDQPWQSLNLYPQASQAHSPVIIFIYGGGWYKGKKEQYHFVADALTRRGYLVVIPDYIKYPKGHFPAFIEDIALATAWVKKNINNHGGDPENILLVGHSAGAHTGALLVTDKHYLAAVGMKPTDLNGFVGLAGPYNFTPTAEQFIKTFGRKNFEVMLANNHVDGDEPPIKLLHSTGDNKVSQFNFNTFRNQLKKTGIPVETVLFERIGHAAMVLKIHPWFADEIDLADEIDQFFKNTASNQSQSHASSNTPEHPTPNNNVIK